MKTYPTKNNCRTHKKNPKFDRIMIDFDLLYLGDNDIQALILKIPVGIKYQKTYYCCKLKCKFLSPHRNVRVSGRCRVVLAPTLAQLPLLAGLQLMFLSMPEVDFQFEGAARLASQLPAIKARILAELAEDAAGEVVFPRRVTLPLSWAGAADPQLVWQPQVAGLLAVRLKKVSGLPKKSKEYICSEIKLCSSTNQAAASARCSARTSRTCTGG